jgi:hypothetical protein
VVFKRTRPQPLFNAAVMSALLGPTALVDMAQGPAHTLTLCSPQCVQITVLLRPFSAAPGALLGQTFLSFLTAGEHGG